MNRLTAKDCKQELLDLYDFYVHGPITKREFQKTVDRVKLMNDFFAGYEHLAAQ